MKCENDPLSIVAMEKHTEAPYISMEKEIVKYSLERAFDELRAGVLRKDTRNLFK